MVNRFEVGQIPGDQGEAITPEALKAYESANARELGKGMFSQAKELAAKIGGGLKKISTNGILIYFELAMGPVIMAIGHEQNSMFGHTPDMPNMILAGKLILVAGAIGLGMNLNELNKGLAEYGPGSEGELTQQNVREINENQK